jgi:hypothetical protein
MIATAVGGRAGVAGSVIAAQLDRDLADDLADRAAQRHTLDAGVVPDQSAVNDQALELMTSA